MFRIIKGDDTFICDKNKHKKERNVAKAMIFKIFYGGSEFTISMDLGVSLSEATDFYQAFFTGYPGLEEDFVRAKKLALQRGWIELDTYTKKRYFFPHFHEMKEAERKAKSYYPDNYMQLSKGEKYEVKEMIKQKYPKVAEYWKTYSILKGKLERAALNYRIQGTSATMTKLAVILMEKFITNLQEGVLLIVHDEVVQEFKADECQKQAEFTVECMRKAGSYFCKTVPMGAEYAIGDYWIH
jgi:DNA polymerase I-like protein with 3'-5' exonuclease and polymerase domains